ncbi:MAG: glycosyltransferase family 2 protein [Pseudomonadota bacterium]|jgi:rhamnosyltransferase
MPTPTPSSPIKASVIIPVKNGGALFKHVLKSVLEQETPWPFEVLVIDSGSKDGSPEYAESLGVRVHHIAPSSFGHGRTRNLGASLSHGEFIVFLTHDAMPADRSWLHNLVSACELTPRTAGAFGRHLAYPDASPITRRELATHFAGFGQEPVTVFLEDRQRYDREEGYRQFLHFFSNNNACLRRSVWETIPFPDVDFAEDQAWAKKIIEAGYEKAYAPDACVYHSHDFGIIETLQRAFDESRALKRIFGYVLAPSLLSGLRSWAYLVRRDLAWLREDVPAGRQRLVLMLRSPFLAGARIAGQYLGGREDRFPAWMTRIISRDKTIQAK